MAASERRAVITGVGVISPAGSDVDTFWQALREGRTGIHALRSVDPSELPCKIGGEVPDFDPKKSIEKKHWRSLRMMARTVQMGVAAACKAMADVAMPAGQLDPARCGVEFGSGMNATDLEDIARAAKVSTNCQPNSVSLQTWGASIGEIPPLWMLKYLPNMPACHVSIMFDAQGPNNSITESDVASVLALGEAYRVIGRDLADFFLVGGAESKMNPLSLARHCLFQPLSRRNDAPEKALRPFDKERDGTVLGEGAGVFGLEELEHAKKRGAKIYGELVGFAAGFDRARDGRVLARVIRQALAEAGIGPEQIDHVNAHGVGTVECDAWEAKGIQEVFGAVRPEVPVWAAKGYFGNLGAAGGAVELAASLLALKHGVLPPTLNYETPDPACPVPVHAGEPRPVSKPYAVKVAFTDLGQCGALVVRRWE